MHTVICRTLKREYRLVCPTAEIAAQLSFVAAEPELPGLSLEPAEVEVGLRDGFLVARLPAGDLIEGSPSHLLSAMHRVIMADLIEGDPDASFVHGATIRIGGRRLLVIGHKGCGKSTLALHLAMAGHDIESDEHLLVRRHEVIARPRTMRVKDGSFGLVAGLPASVWSAPVLTNWDGGTIRSISPAIGGRPWVIRAGQLDAIVFLMANHGGRSAARPIAHAAAFGRLMAEVVLPQAGIAAAAGRLRELVLGVPSYQLLLGDLSVAEWHLRNISSTLT